MDKEINEIIQNRIEDIYQSGEYIYQAKELEEILNYIIDLQKENQKLVKVIDELEKILEFEKNDYSGNIDIETHNIDSEFLRGNSWEADYILNKLTELKGGSDDVEN